MATEIQEQIVREAPDIESRKVALMDSAKSLADIANENALNGEYLTPDYEVAGMSDDQLNALEMGRQGIGAYQPFLTAGARDVTAGSGMLGEAAGMLRGADTRGQFAAAQAAMNQAAIPIQQMGQSAQLATAGVPLIGMGAQGLGNAQNLANQYSQANMDYSMDTLGKGVASLAGATGAYDPSMAAKNFKDLNNPYQQQVIQEAMRQIDRQGDLSRQNLQAQATRAGAFGGSREGVQRAELDRALAEQKNSAIVGALSQGYNQTQQQAQQAFEADKARTLQQAQGYQGIGGLYGQQALQQAQLGQSAAGLQGNLAGQQAGLASLYGNVAGQQANILGQQSQLGQSMAQGIGGLASQQFGIGAQLAQGLGSLGTQQANIGMQNAALGQQAQAQGQQDTNFLYNLGSTQQKQLQGELDAERQNTLQKNMQPYQQAAFVSDIYKGAPSSQMSSMQNVQAAPSPFQQSVGLVTAGVAGAKAVGP